MMNDGWMDRWLVGGYWMEGWMGEGIVEWWIG